MMSRRPARPECAGTRSRRAMTWIGSWSGSAIEPHAGSCGATDGGIFGDFPHRRQGLTSSLPVAQLHLQLGQPLKPKKTGLGAWESAEEKFFVNKLRGFDPQKMVACTLLFEGGPVRWTRRKAA